MKYTCVRLSNATINVFSCCSYTERLVDIRRSPWCSDEGVNLDYDIPIGNKEADGECGLLLYWKVETHYMLIGRRARSALANHDWQPTPTHSL